MVSSLRPAADRQLRGELPLRPMLVGRIVVVNNNLSMLTPARYKDATGEEDLSSRAVRSGADHAVELGALKGHAGYAVRRFQLWIFQDFIKTLAEVDIRPTQYSVMTVIGANPGSTQMAVAKRLGIERARLVHLLNSLERRKLVKRTASATDRRSHALHLTAYGKAQLAKFKRLAAEHERHVAGKIGKENRERLLQILSGFT